MKNKCNYKTMLWGIAGFSKDIAKAAGKWLFKHKAKIFLYTLGILAIPMAYGCALYLTGAAYLTFFSDEAQNINFWISPLKIITSEEHKIVFNAGFWCILSALLVIFVILIIRTIFQISLPNLPNIMNRICERGQANMAVKIGPNEPS